MTLIEVMVALMIFSVVSLAMMGILFTASELFRHGEYSRSALDETVAVTAEIEDDLARIVPAADGGYVQSEISNQSGNTLLAFKIERKDPALVDDQGHGRRFMIVWWVQRASDGIDELWRGETIAADSDQDPNTVDERVKADAVINSPPGIPVARKLVSRDCLHFSAWFSTDLQPRAYAQEWMDLARAPTASIDFDTASTTHAPDPFPSAIRIIATLGGGGRFAPRGTLARAVGDSDTDLHIAGIGALPTTPGSMLRVGDEWIGYTDYRSASVLCSGSLPLVGRGTRRSQKKPHAAGELVRAGATISIVHLLPH